MRGNKIETFMQLAGQDVSTALTTRDEKTRILGAQLLLSEVLEYVINGLGVVPEINGCRISDADSLTYRVGPEEPDKTEMIDGLADVAYTMFWNARAFGVPLEEAFELVCDNNLEKFVRLEPNSEAAEGPLPASEWHCGSNVEWPAEVATVEVLKVGGELYAVGKDERGKVRKPAHFKPVCFAGLDPSGGEPRP